jgi:hypothetical protein
MVTHAGLEMKSGQQATWTFYYSNFGRSPAIALLPRSQIVFGSDNFKKIRANLFTNIHTAGKRGEGSIVPPGFNANFITAISTEALTDDDVRYISDNDAGLVMVAHFEYFDTSGNEYHTEICWARLMTGAVSNCPIHNKLKEKQPRGPVTR